MHLLTPIFHPVRVVMEEALQVLGLRLVRWGSKEMESLHNTPECVSSSPPFSVSVDPTPLSLFFAGSSKASFSTTSFTGTAFAASEPPSGFTTSTLARSRRCGLARCTWG